MRILWTVATLAFYTNKPPFSRSAELVFKRTTWILFNKDICRSEGDGVRGAYLATSIHFLSSSSRILIHVSALSVWVTWREIALIMGDRLGGSFTSVDRIGARSRSNLQGRMIKAPLRCRLSVPVWIKERSNLHFQHPFSRSPQMHVRTRQAGGQTLMDKQRSLFSQRCVCVCVRTRVCVCGVLRDVIRRGGWMLGF